MESRNQTMVKDICHDGGFQGNSTNHSLGATCATTYFETGVPEAIIQKRSRHKSTLALRKYERISPEQDLAVSQDTAKQEAHTFPLVKHKEILTLPLLKKI